MRFWKNAGKTAAGRRATPPGILKTEILDSFAVLFWLQDEGGATGLISRLENAETGALKLVLPLINFGEVLYIVERGFGLMTAQWTQAVVERLPIEILPASRKWVFEAAHIKANYPISYADAFTVAAAQEFDAPILTGDPEFKRVEGVVEISWLRA